MKEKRYSGLAGKNQYEDFKNGIKLTRKQAMQAKCFECMGGFADGRQDCLGVSCPLYNFYPYKAKNSDRKAQISTILSKEGQR